MIAPDHQLEVRTRRISDRLPQASDRDEFVNLLRVLMGRIRCRAAEPVSPLIDNFEHGETWRRAIHWQRLHREYRALMDEAAELRRQAETARRDQLATLQRDSAALARRFRHYEESEAQVLVSLWEAELEIGA